MYILEIEALREALPNEKENDSGNLVCCNGIKYSADIVNPTDLSIYTGSLISQYALTSMYHQEYPGMTQTMAYYAHNQMTSIFYKNYMTGDVNLDKQVTMADALKLSQYLAGLTALDSRAQLLADTNQNGIVNSADFDELRYFLSGISTN